MRPRSTYALIALAIIILAVLTGVPFAAAAPVAVPKGTRSADLGRLAHRFRQIRAEEASTLVSLVPPSVAQLALTEDPALALVRLDRRGHPRYYLLENLIAAQTVSTDEVWPGGSSGYELTGSGLALGALAVWDAGGVRLGHQEFGGRVVQMDTPGSTHYHSTHVAGTLVAAGVDPSARGMAYQAPLAAYDWNDDDGEMAAAAASGLLISNHSYGFAAGWYYSRSSGDWYWFGDISVSPIEDHYFGFYSSYTADWDQIACDAPYYTIVKSAGNDRNDFGPDPGDGHWVWDPDADEWIWSTDARNVDGGPDGYDCLPTRAVAKNPLTIGAIEDIPGGYEDPADVVMSTFSGWGPTDDGRIKPDLVANGVGLYSATDSGDDEYQTLSGTSMSAPNTSGSIALVVERYQSLRGGAPLASTVKAILIQTADEAGDDPGPDYEYGWGLLNTRAAIDLVDADSEDPRRIIEATLADGETDRYYVKSDGSPISLTLCWTDAPGTPPPDVLDPPDPVLVNDLDLRLEEEGSATVFEPYLLDPASPGDPAATGDNARDNVEQIEAAAPLAGDYIVTVHHKGTLTGDQTYSLASSAALTTFRVCPDGSGDFANVQAAIVAAAPLDVIELCCNREFSGPGNRDLDFAGKAVILRSRCADAGRCVIDAGGAPGEPHRGFVFQTGEGRDAVLQDLTITGGWVVGEAGGGVWCAAGASPTLRGCRLTGNAATGLGGHGGGLACTGGAPHLVECLLVDNLAADAGSHGGGIYAEQGDPFLETCTFANNEAGGSGGGFYGGDHASPTIVKSTFYRNAADEGGGIAIAEGTLLVLETSIIAYSTAGEAVACADSSVAMLSCCDVYGNAGGDWVGCIAGLSGLNDNLDQDPLFCEDVNPLRPYILNGASPCAAENNPACGQIGAWPVGCGAPQVLVSDPAPQSPLRWLAGEPNPSAEGVLLRVLLPERLAGQPGSLALLDPAGRLVRRLLIERFAGGEKTLTWDGRDGRGRRVPAGVYYGVLQVGGERITHSLVIVR
ncbi:MAG: S8 family serine peptidase [Candidatus Eisenbacteria sp.]|nr:S8 family serine peptidase [Candidatus Eisenbacteria bacterium]